MPFERATYGARGADASGNSKGVPIILASSKLETEKKSLALSVLRPEEALPRPNRPIPSHVYSPFSLATLPKYGYNFATVQHHPAR